jgi:hypothetical protein
MNELDRLRHLIGLVRDAARPERLADALRDDDSEAAGALASLGAVREIIGRRRGVGLQSVSAVNQRALASRALLGRWADFLEAASGFWTANGTPAAVVAKAVEAARAARPAGLSGVVDLSRDDPRSLPSSSCYARFVAALAEIEGQDDRGPLGNAVRASRYAGGRGRTLERPFLPGEGRVPVGFPVALGQGDGPAATLRGAAWVHPVWCWPGWPSGGSVAGAGPDADALANCLALRSRWCGLVNRVNVLLNSSGYDAAQGDPGFPDWLAGFVGLHGVDDVESAGLALAVGALAAAEEWPLPAGVGFSGAWGEDGRLRPVGRIREKIGAAREGGIFVLFVCAEAGRLSADDVAGGPLLVLLPPHASLADIVRLVNTACHSLGLTADRGLWVSEVQRGRCRSLRGGRAPSRLLPDAAEPGSLPVGFIGRERELGQLAEWKEEASRSRRLAVLRGGMRAGKTTLAAHWLQDTATWPVYPAWFSCVRGHLSASRLEHVQRGLEAQILATFRLLPGPKGQGQESIPGVAPGDGWSRCVREACAATDAAIDLVLDGIDEVRENDQRAVVDLVASLPGSGLALLVGQVGTPALDEAREARVFELRSDRGAALRLIQAFAGRLRVDPALREFGERLGGDEGWQHELARRTGDNLWILTEVLDAVLQRLAPVPERPDDCSLRGDVEAYVLNLLGEVIDSRSGSERTSLRNLVRTLALLDVGEETWSVADLARICPLSLAAGDIEDAAEGPLRRFLLFQAGGLRFRDDTFRQVIASDTVRRDRGRGRDLAVWLVDVLQERGGTPSPFLSDFAAAQAASFVLLHAEGDGPLAHRLLVQTLWPARRFRQVTASIPSLTTFLEELDGLYRTATASGRANGTGPVSELLQALAHWRPAIEAGSVSGVQWWSHLPAATQRGLAGPLPSVAAGAESGTVLLTPVGGYGPQQPGDCELNGAACAAHDGTTERIALAATRGRLLVYLRRGGEFHFERLHSFESGRVAKLEPADGPLVLAMTCGPRGKDEERRRLWLVDLASPLPPSEIEIPAEAEDFTVLHAGDGQVAVVLAVASGGESKLLPCRLHHGRGITAAPSVGLISEGTPYPTPYRVKHLCSFAPGTWAAYGTVGGDWRGECVLGVYRLSSNGVEEVTSPEVAETVRDFWVTGVCPVPGERLAAVRFPTTPDGEGAALIVLTGAGAVDFQVPISPTPHCRVGAMLGSEVDSCSSYRPLGWHRHLHLLLGHSQSTYHCLSLEPGALPQPIPAEINQQILYSDDAGTTLYGACPLEGGRTLLVFRGFAAVLGPGPNDISRVTSNRGCSTCLLGVAPTGSVAACDERYRDDHGNPVRTRSNHRYLLPPGAERGEIAAESGFLNVGPEGASLSLSPGGTQLVLTWGGQHPVVLYDVTSDPGIPARSKRRRVLHAFAQDERNWAATVLAMLGDDSANRAAMRMVGRVDGRPMGMLVPEVDGDDPYDGFGLVIGALCASVIGIKQEATKRVIREMRVFDLSMFDLPVETDPGAPSIDYSGRRVDGRADHFYRPLLRVSEDWTLILEYSLEFAHPDGEETAPARQLSGTLPYTPEAVFTVRQYRIGSMEPPSPVEGLTLGGGAVVLERSANRADLLDLRRVGAWTHAQVKQLGVDPAAGVRLLSQHQPVNLGRFVSSVVALDAGHVVVAYDSVPFRVEVRSLWPRRGEEMPAPVAVGYLSEPPKQVLVSRGSQGVYLVVATESHVAWFDMGEVKCLSN